MYTQIDVRIENECDIITILPSNRKHFEQSHILVIHVLRLGLVRAVSASAVAFKFDQNKPFKVIRLMRKSSEDFGNLCESLDVFVSSSKNPALPGKKISSLQLGKSSQVY